MSFTLGDVAEGELARVHELNESGQPHVNSIPLSELAKFHLTAPYFRVARLQEGTVAAFLVGLEPDADYDSVNFQFFRSHYPSFVYIDRIVVDDAVRGGGIARAMYEDIERFARGRGRPMLCAEVNVKPMNEGSILFHHRFGFREVGQQDTTGGAKRVSLLVKELE